MKEERMAGSERVAIVTGASRGLGLVIAGVMARHGYDLVIGARDAGALARAAEELRTVGGRVVVVPGDVAEAGVRERLIDQARQLGGLDVLVNNASELGVIEAAADIDLARVRRVFAVNVEAPLALIQLAVPLMRPLRSRIVNVSSDAARGAYPGWGGYGASKAALELLTKTLAAELGDRGIAVVAVDPGDMRTDMHQAAFPGEDISDRPLPDVTIPFWEWLFDEDGGRVTGERFEAQKEDARWLLQV
jgi:NAD(P)-dependent dehydrogenase (short-subunit alcohol dehydrogenase family)